MSSSTGRLEVGFANAPKMFCSIPASDSVVVTGAVLGWAVGLGKTRWIVAALGVALEVAVWVEVVASGAVALLEAVVDPVVVPPLVVSGLGLATGGVLEQIWLSGLRACRHLPV